MSEIVQKPKHELPEAKGQFTIASWDNYAVMRLRSPSGEKMTCYFDRDLDFLPLVTTVCATVAMPFAVAFALADLGLSFGLFSALVVSVPVLAGIPLIAGTPFRGRIRQKEVKFSTIKTGKFGDEFVAVYYDISQDKFDTMKADLLKERFYIYSHTQNNCSHFMARFAFKHGFHDFRQFLNTPFKMRRRLLEMTGGHKFAKLKPSRSGDTCAVS